MSQALLDNFIDKKKAESNFLSLTDGESVKVKSLKEIKPMTKQGFGGEEKDVLRFVLEVETSAGTKDKNFDNGTQRFVEEVKAKGLKIGSAFTLTRTGLNTKTRYTISNVSNPVSQSAAATQVFTSAPPAEKTPFDDV